MMETGTFSVDGYVTEIYSYTLSITAAERKTDLHDANRELINMAVYIDKINGDFRSGKDSEGKPIQLHYDGRNFFQLRALIELLGGTVYYNDLTNMSGYWVKHADGNWKSGTLERLSDAFVWFPQPASYSNSSSNLTGFNQNGRIYIQFRNLLEQLGYKDCISWWNNPITNEQDILVKTCMVYAPEKMMREGNKLTITAYKNFDNNSKNITFKHVKGEETYAQLLKKSMGMWEAVYTQQNDRIVNDFLGNDKNLPVAINVVEKGMVPIAAQQKFVQVSLDDGIFMLTAKEKADYGNISTIIALTNDLIWGRYNGEASMHLSTKHYSDSGTYYSKEMFKELTAHEFGHLLGLKHFAGKSIMNSPMLGSNKNGERVAQTPRTVLLSDMEQLLKGWLLNVQQGVN